MVEFLAIMAILAATIIFGATAWEARTLTIWAPVLLILAVFAVAPVNGFITEYWPNALILPLSIAWAVIGVSRWLRPVVPRLTEQRP